MTAPADVWAVETRPMDSGSGETGAWKLEGDNQQMPLFWNTRAGADDFAQNFLRPARVVRFRLVRVDEPAVGQDHWRHAANEWADRLCDVVPLLDLIGSGTMDVGTAISEVRTWIARCRESQPASPDAEPAAQRDEVGDLRECVKDILSIVMTMASATEPAEDIQLACAIVVQRLAAQSGPAGEVGDG